MSEAEAIRSEIERSRADMARTLDALSTRLSPRVQSHQLADRLRERVRRVRADPARTALIAGGAVATILVVRRVRRRALSRREQLRHSGNP